MSRNTMGHDIENKKNRGYQHMKKTPADDTSYAVQY